MWYGRGRDIVERPARAPGAPGPSGRCGRRGWCAAARPGSPPPRSPPRARRPASAGPLTTWCAPVVGGERHAVRERVAHAAGEREHRSHCAAIRQRAHQCAAPRRGNAVRVSRSNAPAAWAAATSPTLCPNTTSGRTPTLAHKRGQRASPARRARAASTRCGRAPPCRRTSHRAATRRAPPRTPPRTGQHLGEDRFAVVELATHPHPLATLTRIEEGDLVRRGRLARGGGAPVAPAPAAPRSSPSSRKTRPARCAKWLRPRQAVQAMSASGGSAARKVP